MCGVWCVGVKNVMCCVVCVCCVVQYVCTCLQCVWYVCMCSVGGDVWDDVWYVWCGVCGSVYVGGMWCGALCVMCVYMGCSVMCVYVGCGA